jgi:hypothetical protein
MQADADPPFAGRLNERQAAAEDLVVIVGSAWPRLGNVGGRWECGRRLRRLLSWIRSVWKVEPGPAFLSPDHLIARRVVREGCELFRLLLDLEIHHVAAAVRPGGFVEFATVAVDEDEPRPLGRSMLRRPSLYPKGSVAFAPDMLLPNATPPLSNVPLIEAEVLFYIASVFEARVNAFVSTLAQMRPDVQAIWLERGYQRLDGTHARRALGEEATAGGLLSRFYSEFAAMPTGEMLELGGAR